MRLLVAAAAAALVAIASSSSNGAGESLQCHKVKDSQKFKGGIVSPDAEGTAFDVPPNCTLTGKAAEYCAPASVTIQSTGEAPVPPVAPEGGEIANAVLCYKMKCAAAATLPSSVTDAFGYRELAYKPAGKICVPVAQGVVTTTTTTLPSCFDDDSDGWSDCDGDCCETAGSCGDSPQYVNPGALEVVGNGIDDDCDAATSDETEPAACSTAPDFSVTATDLAQALDICRTTSANPPLSERKWGLVSASLLLANGTTPTAPQLTNMETYQGAVLANYGTVIVPQKNATMVGLSSGRMRDTNDSGYIAPVNGTDFGVDSTPPSGWLSANGGTIPASGGCNGVCASTSAANDPVNLRLQLRVPTNATSLSFDARFFVADFADYQCTQFNDAFLALLSSTASGNPADKNIARDIEGSTLSTNDMYYEVCNAQECNLCPYGTADLTGTGMSASGGGTIWRTMTGAVVPGETITLDLMVFDGSDNIDDSNALIDNFRWGLAAGVELP